MTISQIENPKTPGVSVLDFTIYLKFFKKGWLLAVIPGLVLAFFGVMMTIIWPEFEDILTENPAFKDLLKNPIYTALLGGGALDIDTFQGFFAIEVFTILEFLMLFLVVFVPVRLISNEVDKNTLDIALSYPIPRWQFLIQKYLVYFTQMAFVPVFIFLSAIIGTEAISQTFDYAGLVLACVAILALFFSLGALSLLASTLLLESGRSLTGAAVLVIGMWIIDRMGALVESLNFLQDFSIFHYLIPRSILSSNELPLDNFFTVILTGVIALISALYIFQNRELAY